MLGLKPPNMIYLSDAKPSSRNTKCISKYLCFLLKNSKTHRTTEQGSPVELSATATAKSLQSYPTVWPHPWDSPGKDTGVGCHFLLQCIKVTSESEVAQSCLTLWDPMDCSLAGSSVHRIFQAREFSRGVEMFIVCTIQHGSHQPPSATRNWIGIVLSHFECKYSHVASGSLWLPYWTTRF